MAHSLHIKSAGEKENEYRVTVSGGIEAAAGIGGRDHVTDEGRTAVGRVVGGTDEWAYWGSQQSIEATDPTDLQLSVNGKPWQPATAFGATASDSPPAGTDTDTAADPGDVGGSFEGPAGNSERDLTPTYGCVDRPLTTTHDETIRIGGGEDSGTVQGFANTVPRFVEHRFIGQLAKGVHASEPGDSVNIAPSVVLASTGKLKLVGDKDAPRDYVLDARQINIQGLVGTAQDLAIEGVHIKGTVQNRVGNVEIDGCVLSAGDGRWGKGDAVPIDTYGGHLQIIETEIESSGVAFNLVENASVSLNANCSVDAAGPLCSSGQGGGELILGGIVALSCNGAITRGFEPGLVRVMDGHGATLGLETGAHGRVFK